MRLLVGGSTLVIVLLTAVAQGAYVTGTENVDTTARAGSYLDRSTSVVYAYDPSADALVPVGATRDYAYYIHYDVTNCESLTVCVTISVRVKDNAHVTWEVKAHPDTGGEDKRQHGPFVTVNTDLVTAVAGASKDSFSAPGYAIVRLLIDGAVYSTSGIHYQA